MKPLMFFLSWHVLIIISFDVPTYRAIRFCALLMFRKGNGIEHRTMRQRNLIGSLLSASPAPISCRYNYHNSAVELINIARTLLQLHEQHALS